MSAPRSAAEASAPDATAYYLPTADAARFVATELTTGPWGAGLQHGGPPSALLARAVEATPGSWPATVTRLTVELLGPVAVAEVEVQATLVRPGRSVELIEAELSVEGRVAARAHAWRIRRSALDLPTASAGRVEVGGDAAPRLPARSEPPMSAWGPFVESLESRVVEGRWQQLGDATVWLRPRVPLVAGELPSGLQSTMIVADCGNGLSATLPVERWLFINPELTVHVSRHGSGGWRCVQATTRVDPAGFGLASSRIYDADGLTALGAQTLLVAPR